MSLQKDDLEEIKALIRSALPLQQSPPANSLFDMEARDRIIQTNELIRQRQEKDQKTFELLEQQINAIDKKLNVIDARLEKAEKNAELFDKRYKSLATWLNHYQSWSIMLAIATAVSVILGLRYFPF